MLTVQKKSWNFGSANWNQKYWIYDKKVLYHFQFNFALSRCLSHLDTVCIEVWALWCVSELKTQIKMKLPMFWDKTIWPLCKLKCYRKNILKTPVSRCCRKPWLFEIPSSTSFLLNGWINSECEKNLTKAVSVPHLLMSYRNIGNLL